MSKVENLINEYNQERATLQTEVGIWKKTLLPNEVLRKETEKKNGIEEHYLPQINSLISELSKKPEELTKKLTQKRYPNTFNKDNKLAGEQQISNAQTIMAIGNEEKIIQQLELALSTERYDFVSYVLDSLLPENKGTMLEVKLKSIQDQLNKVLNLDGDISEIQDAKREIKIAEIFLRDVIADKETAVYPYTQNVIKIMPLNIVTAQLDKVTRSLEINGMVK